MKQAQNRIVIYFLLIYVLTACKVSQSISVPYTSFFIDNNVSLYFIKPLKFKGPKTSLLIDFTFKDNQSVDTPFVTCNYTIECLSSNCKDNLIIQAAAAQPVLAPQVLFTEMEKGKLIRRFTAKIPLTSFLNMLHNTIFDCVIGNRNAKDEVEICKADNKTKARFKKIQSQLLPTLDFNAPKK